MSLTKIKNPGTVLAVASPVFYSIFNASLKIASNDISVFGLLFLRGLSGMLLAVVVFRLAKIRPVINNLGLLIGVGIITALASVSVTMTITLIPLYQAVVLLYLYPAFSVILSMFIVKDRITLLGLAGVLTAFAGCILLVWPDQKAGLELSAGHALGILGAFLYALGFVMTRKLGQAHSGLEPFFAFCLAGVLISWPLSAVLGSGLGIDSPREVCFGLAVVSTGSLAQLMAFAALKYLPAFKVGVIGTMEVLGGSLASWFLFSDPFTVRTVIGAIIVLYAAFGFRAKEPKIAAA
ncbi:MAG: DMT family transporter [Deltaproteobacteria bacterium]|jgi:drug/metabolite transporter (DMT)-like permease|nr:DMT family transporter [Deltaproteobacteria bacterium]